jgi:hypothetical protein
MAQHDETSGNDSEFRPVHAVAYAQAIADAFGLYTGTLCSDCPGWTRSCCIFDYAPSASD